MKPIWIIVANQTQARIFSVESPVCDELNEIEEIIHDQGRLHDREITSDLPGKIKSVAGGGHAYESPTDPKQHEADNFAHRLARRLESAHNADAFSQLAIIAEPGILGLLRHCLPEQVKKSVCFELDKNLARHSAEEIRLHLPARLPI